MSVVKRVRMLMVSSVKSDLHCSCLGLLLMTVLFSKFILQQGKHDHVRFSLRAAPSDVLKPLVSQGVYSNT